MADDDVAATQTDPGPAGPDPLPDGVRELTAGDLEWAIDLLAARRSRLAQYAPRMWRPAPGARAAHEPFLTRQIADPSVATLRTDHGFVFGPRRGEYVSVDDFAVDDEARWADDGALLLCAATGGRPVRLVGTAPEAELTALAVRLGLVEYESWWHHDLGPDLPADGEPAQLPDDPELTVDGAAGRLVPSPPVYAPGGPVLFLGEATEAGAVGRLEQRAVELGSPVAIAAVPAADTGRATVLAAAGYRPTSVFYQGTVS